MPSSGANPHQVGAWQVLDQPAGGVVGRPATEVLDQLGGGEVTDLVPGLATPKAMRLWDLPVPAGPTAQWLSAARIRSSEARWSNVASGSRRRRGRTPRSAGPAPAPQAAFSRRSPPSRSAGSSVGAVMTPVRPCQGVLSQRPGRDRRWLQYQSIGGGCRLRVRRRRPGSSGRPRLAGSGRDLGRRCAYLYAETP